VLDVGGHDRNVITLAPALTISYDEIGLALKLLDRLLHRVTRR
jgi:4-aminobutyrate aminotransferase-like enzyme